MHRSRRTIHFCYSSINFKKLNSRNVLIKRGYAQLQTNSSNKSLATDGDNIHRDPTIKHLEDFKTLSEICKNRNVNLVLNSFAHIIMSGGNLKMDKKIQFNQIKEKLLLLATNKTDYHSGVKLSTLYDTAQTEVQLLSLCYQLALQYGSCKTAFQIQYGTIIKLLDMEKIDDIIPVLKKIVNFVNIKFLIDLLSVKKGTELDNIQLQNICYLVPMYNRLMNRLTSKFKIPFNHAVTPYLFSDSQIKRIIDKSIILNSIQFKSNEHISTIEIVIKELGYTISKYLSMKLSLYNDKQEIDLIEELNNGQLLYRYLHFTYTIIQDRVKHQDPTTVYNIWTIIKPFHNKLYNSKIASSTNNNLNNFYYYQTLSQIISLFSKNRRFRSLVDDIISDLPLESVKVCPELMTSLIYHSSRTENFNLSSILMKQYGDDTLGLPTKYNEGQLRALLALNLKMLDWKRAKEIVQFLKDNLMGFTAADFNEIVRAVLRHGKDITDKTGEINMNTVHEKEANAWKMVIDNENKGINRYAMISYLDYMIDNMNRGLLDFNKIDKIFQMAINNIDRKDKNFWNYFYLSYFKYLNKKFPLEMSIEVYKNSGLGENAIFKALSDYNYEINPFLTRFDKLKLPLNPEIRRIILRDIFQTSYSYFKRGKYLQSDDLEETKRQFKAISGWCYQESMKLGYNRNTLIIDTLKTIRKSAKKVGFNIQITEKERLNSIKQDYMKKKNGISMETPLEEQYVRSYQDIYDQWDPDRLLKGRNKKAN